MSAAWVPVQEEQQVDPPVGLQPPVEDRRPPLRIVPKALPRLARAPFILVLIAVFGLGMTGLLMLNTTLQNQAFEASTLTRQATELTYTQAELESRLDQAAAPQVLAQRASAYGLRANPHPAFLVLPEGDVLGKPRAVTGNEVPAMIVKTPAQIAAEAAAEARKRAFAEQQKLAAKKAAEAQQAAKARELQKADQKKADPKKADPKKADSKKAPKPGGDG